MKSFFDFTVNFLNDAKYIVKTEGEGTSEVSNSDRAKGTWYIKDNCDFISDIAPHEIGHFMNLFDRYDSVLDAKGRRIGTAPWNDMRGDWRGNIMGERRGAVDERNVMDAINSANERNGDCSCE